MNIKNIWNHHPGVYVRLLEEIPVVVVVRDLNMCWVRTRVWTTSSFLLRARFECLFMSLPWELMTWLLTGLKIISEHEFFRTRDHGFISLPPIQNGLKHEALPDKTLSWSGWREISKNGCWQITTNTCTNCTAVRSPECTPSETIALSTWPHRSVSRFRRAPYLLRWAGHLAPYFLRIEGTNM